MAHLNLLAATDRTRLETSSGLLVSEDRPSAHLTTDNLRRKKMSRDKKVAVVEAYLEGLRSKDLSNVPIASDITCEARSCRN